MYTRATITDTLRDLQRQHPGVEPHIVIARSDPRLCGTDLFPCDGAGLPSLRPGSHGTCRISSPDGEDGLHATLGREELVIHLDPVDARRRPIAHVHDATMVAPGAALGGAVGAAGGPWGILGGLIFGGLVGALIERRPAKYFEVRSCGHVVPRVATKPTMSWA